MEQSASLVCLLTGEVFYTPGQTRQKPHLGCFWLGWGVLLGVQAADLMFSTSSHVAGLCAQSTQNWLVGRFGFAEFSHGQCWKMLVCSFLFHPPPL